MLNKYLVVFFLLFGAYFNSNAQSSYKSKTIVGAEVHEYYLYIDSVNTKDDVEKVEALIRSNKVVTYFIGNKFPVRYFQLKTSKSITQKEFENWIKATQYKLFAFGEGEAALEYVLLEKLKLKKKKL
jgi:hypothetical protein